jgi:pyruvate formate lyase activating enzyme
MKARIVNIQKFSLHDGPGIRTLVFFKGCPLHCLWCANPECINPLPEIGFNKTICDGCGKCARACHLKIITPDERGLPQINRDRCTACGECTSVCAPKALVIYGKDVPLEELFKEVQSDALFYESSNGGVTVSGGEPLLEADYIEALFKMCRQAGITTAMETCGQVNPATLIKILRQVDFVFYDLKAMDEKKHMELTGRSNKLILDNARIAAESAVQLMFRMPLIPGLNDDIDNIKATSEFIRSLGRDSILSIELMPYHRLGMGKYEALDREYCLKSLDMASIQAVESARKHFEESGIECSVSR